MEEEEEEEEDARRASSVLLFIKRLGEGPLGAASPEKSTFVNKRVPTLDKRQLLEKENRLV